MKHEWFQVRKGAYWPVTYIQRTLKELCDVLFFLVVLLKFLEAGEVAKGGLGRGLTCGMGCLAGCRMQTADCKERKSECKMQVTYLGKARLCSCAAKCVTQCRGGG